MTKQAHHGKGFDQTITKFPTNGTHWISAPNTEPTLVVDANAGVGATAVLAGPSGDVAGYITLTTGTIGTCGAGSQLEVQFANAFLNDNVVVILQPVDETTAFSIFTNSIDPYVTVTKDSFILNFSNADAGETALKFYYHCVGVN